MTTVIALPSAPQSATTIDPTPVAPVSQSAGQNGALTEATQPAASDLTLLRIEGDKTYYRRGDGTTFYTVPSDQIEHSVDAAGALLVRAYDADPDFFLKTFDSFGPSIQARVTFAVAAALGCDPGHVDAAWLDARLAF